MSGLSEATWLGLVVLGWLFISALIAGLVLVLRLREARQRVRDMETEHQAVLDRLLENENRLRAIIESEPDLDDWSNSAVLNAD